MVGSSEEYTPSRSQGIRETLEGCGKPAIQLLTLRLHLRWFIPRCRLSELAFSLAGSIAAREGIKLNELTQSLLEPVMKEVTPEDFMGDIIGDLNSHVADVSDAMEDLMGGANEAAQR